ncbi:MAG TPA: thioester reductase domain-containing protein, partial [Ktedonobacteraceae bacterium]|nr:thioester reductase domain-containing protein [Ktedonobacteraceae bacterium]
AQGNRKGWPLPSTLQTYLHEQLPAYMVPAVFVELESLPLTTNGKLDRKALPIPEQGGGGHQGELVAPRSATEEQLVTIWSQLLGVEQVSVEDDFFVIGGHSLLAMRLVMQLREQFSIEFSLRNVFEASTLAGMARMVDEFLAGNITSTTASDERAWYEDAVLDPAIRTDGLQFPAHSQPGSCTSIFLTGATGFLGAHLLFELLQQTRATIYCLVRADSMEQGRRRLYQQLNVYQLWQETIDASRIVPVPGDLGSPLFGLSMQEFYQLAAQIDVIYHNGASVNIIAPYPVLRSANVLGTQEVLRLASTESLKPIHYVSTISVLATSGTDEEALISEQVSLDTQREYMMTGYAQSKWNAEKLVQQALERGIPTCIYRPGRISGHTSTGVWNPDDYLCRIIRGCIQLGCVPDVEEYIDMTPVDYLSQAIVHLSQHAAAPGKVFHLFNPAPATVAELVAYARSFGYQVERPPYNEWRARVQQAIQEMPEHAFAPILTFFPETQSPEEENETGLHTMFMATNTRAGLANMTPYPSINEQLIHAYLSFLLQKGLLPSPSLIDHE